MYSKILLLSLIGSSLSHASPMATYHVPTPDDLELVEYATMELRDVDARVRSDGRVELKYRLPPELDGEEGLYLDLAGVQTEGQGLVNLSGQSLTPGCVPTSTEDLSCVVRTAADCEVAHYGDLRCTVYYGGLTLDFARAEAYMRGQGFADAHVIQMLAVGERLDHQAIGVVTVPRALIRN